jgi:hypothetical protein
MAEMTVATLKAKGGQTPSWNASVPRLSEAKAA